MQPLICKQGKEELIPKQSQKLQEVLKAGLPSIEFCHDYHANYGHTLMQGRGMAMHMVSRYLARLTARCMFETQRRHLARIWTLMSLSLDACHEAVESPIHRADARRATKPGSALGSEWARSQAGRLQPIKLSRNTRTTPNRCSLPQS